MRWLSAAVFVAVFFTLTMMPWPWRVFKMDYGLGLATLLFLWIVLSAKERMNQETGVVRGTRRLAGSSYSLYLVHYPFLAFMSVLVGAQGHWQPVPRFLAAGAAFCAAAVLYSFGVAACTEWHNDSVRRWVEERLFGRSRVREAAAVRL